MTKSLITTHILDTAIGKPAAKVPVTLFKLQDQQWIELASADTDADGRIMQWPVDDAQLTYGTYKLNFNIAAYDGDSFYPFAEVCFKRRDDRHHHVPLLLQPFGYSTYRGS